MRVITATGLMLCASMALCANIPEKTFKRLLGPYRSCFLLYSIDEKRLVSAYNPENYCNIRISPDSTFKVAVSLMAFDKGIITQKTVFKWNGVSEGLQEWNRNQTPQSWLQYSVVWVTQLLTRQMGLKTIQHYLDGFHYGNRDFSGDSGMNNGLTHAWLSSSLKISAMEQMDFLKNMMDGSLKVSPGAVKYTTENMYIGALEQGARLYGKTGAGRNGRNERLSNPSQLRDGWFIGFVEQGNRRFIFVSNLTDRVPASDHFAHGQPAVAPYGSQVLKPLVLTLLNTFFS